MHVRHTPPTLQSHVHTGHAPAGGVGHGHTTALRQRQADDLPSVGEQLSKKLFTQAKPDSLAQDDYPELQQMLLALEPYKRRLAALAGDKDADYTLVLAATGSAAIDERGLIFLGVGFLRAHRQNIGVVVGAIAHEIGHRPKRMRTLQLHQALSVDELNALLMQEEILADRFAGFGMGELALDPEPLIAFLIAAQSPPHPAYLPVQERARLIRECCAQGQNRAKNRRKLFPEFDRHTSARNHLRDL